MHKKKQRNQKSQASLEYLTTYAWAFILIVIMIGAITYFGVINPKKLLPGRCILSSELECKDHSISIAEKAIRLKLKNNVGEPIKIISYVVKTETIPSLCTKAFLGETTGSAADIVWNSGELLDVKIAECDFTRAGISAGSQEKFQLILTYYNAKSTSAYSHIVEGEILGTVK